MEYLYVCHFSNGHIKVGRSIAPKARIASHADRVGCMGIELVDHFIVECAGHSAPAESALIERCAELATKRNKSEWFEGLGYFAVCEFAQQIAAQKFDTVGMDLKSFLSTMDAEARDKFAARCETTRGHLQNVMYGLKTCATDLAVHIERESGGVVRRWDLRPDWDKHWPELIGQDGAPAVPCAPEHDHHHHHKAVA